MKSWRMSEIGECGIKMEPIGCDTCHNCVLDEDGAHFGECVE